MAERHPSRTLLLVPRPELEDGLDALVSVRCFPFGDRAICGEVIELTLRGARAAAPASIVLPLLISDLPVFCRWRGRPEWESPAFQQLVDVIDRLVVDSTEWPDVPADYADLAALFDRVAVSDIAWDRTERWRGLLASLWPGDRGREVDHGARHPCAGASAARLARLAPGPRREAGVGRARASGGHRPGRPTSPVPPGQSAECERRPFSPARPFLAERGVRSGRARRRRSDSTPRGVRLVSDTRERHDGVKTLHIAGGCPRVQAPSRGGSSTIRDRRCDLPRQRERPFMA